MNRAARRRAGRPAFELIDSAVHLLRTAPAGVLLSYYTGSIPCVLGLLFFMADMGSGAFARERLIEASFRAALLFLWMKCWHSVFAARLRAHLTLQADAPWTPGRVARLVLTQAAVQPAGLFVRLIAAQIILPYVWVHCFFQNVGILGDGTRSGLGEVVRESARQARLWLGQAHGAMAAMFLFTFFVWLNICIVVALAPMLLKSFFDIETVFSRSPFAMFNTTTFATTLAATYLCIDPILKAIFILRCFHGASLKSGEDLRVELKTLRSPVRTAAAVVLLIAACVLPLAPMRAAEPAPAQAPRVESAELNSALDRVLERREYSWRLPREAEKIDDSQKGWLTMFFEEIWDSLVRTIKRMERWMGELMKWLRDLFNQRQEHDEERGKIDWTGTARGTLIALIGALAIMLCVLLWRWRRGRRVEAAIAEPFAAVPDLNEEDVTADQLPEDGWLRMARDLMERGELRLALRAFYLAGLAHLGHRELIQIARYKSNRDYDRELRRRARGNADLLTAFDANLLTFEAAWYGEHAVTSDTLGGFSQNLERIRAC